MHASSSSPRPAAFTSLSAPPALPLPAAASARKPGPGPDVLGVGHHVDHKGMRPAAEPSAGSRSLTTRLRPPASPAATPSLQQQVERALGQIAIDLLDGPKPPSCCPWGSSGETPTNFAARLRAELDAVARIRGCTAQTPEGRKELLRILLAVRSSDLLQPAMVLTGNGGRLGLGPDGAEHRSLFDALMQRLFQPLGRAVMELPTRTTATPPELIEAFALLETIADSPPPRTRPLLQQATSALARACGGAHMRAATLEWFETLVFMSSACDVAPIWLYGSLTGLALGVSNNGDDRLRTHVEALPAKHLHELGPRQIKTLLGLPLPLDRAGEYTAEQFGGMVMAHHLNEEQLARLHQAVAKASPPLSSGHIVAFGCAAMCAGGDTQQQRDLRRQYLPTYPKRQRDLWELGARLARSPDLAWTHEGLSDADRQAFFRIVLDVTDPDPDRCAMLLDDDAVHEDTAEAILRSRPAEYTLTALPRLSERIVEACVQDAARASKPAPVAGTDRATSPKSSPTGLDEEPDKEEAPVDAPMLRETKAGSLPPADDFSPRARANGPFNTRMLTLYDILAERCLAARPAELAQLIEAVEEERTRVKSAKEGIGRLPSLQALVCERLALLIGQLEAAAAERGANPQARDAASRERQAAPH